MLKGMCAKMRDRTWETRLKTPIGFNTDSLLLLKPPVYKKLYYLKPPV